MAIIESWVFVSVNQEFRVIAKDIVDGLTHTTDDLFSSGSFLFAIQTFPGEYPMINPIMQIGEPYELLRSETLAERLSPFSGFAISACGQGGSPDDEVSQRVFFVAYCEGSKISVALVFEAMKDEIIFIDESEDAMAGDLYDAMCGFDEMRRTHAKLVAQRGCND